MKIELLVISDIYGDNQVIDQLAKYLEQKESYTLVAGDIGLYRNWANDLERYQTATKQILEKISSFSKRVFYIPGDTDNEGLEVNSKRIVNLDGNYTLISDAKRVGIIGLGGAPKKSLQEPEDFSYYWDEGERFIGEEIERTLRINLEKVKREDPDIIILLSHSPPYGILDKSIPISLRELLDREELPNNNPKKKSAARSNPKHLGSRTLKRFLKENAVDMHIFGHIHKQGGTYQETEETKIFNAGHLAPEPRKLYGRKFLEIDLSKGIDWRFQSVVDNKLPFESFLETYL